MTQRETVLRMLKEAGDEGVRSDAFYKAYLPRAGARIWELRQEGHEITSEQEKQFVRYRLIATRAERTSGTRVGARSNVSPGSGGSPGSSGPPVAGGTARLFTPPPLNPLRDQEAA